MLQARLLRCAVNDSNFITVIKKHGVIVSTVICYVLIVVRLLNLALFFGLNDSTSACIIKEIYMIFFILISNRIIGLLCWLSLSFSVRKFQLETIH